MVLILSVLPLMTIIGSFLLLRIRLVFIGMIQCNRRLWRPLCTEAGRFWGKAVRWSQGSSCIIAHLQPILCSILFCFLWPLSESLLTWAQLLKLVICSTYCLCSLSMLCPMLKMDRVEIKGREKLKSFEVVPASWIVLEELRVIFGLWMGLERWCRKMCEILVVHY